MCRYLYVSQLKLLTTNSALDLAGLLVRAYFHFSPSVVLSSTTEIRSTVAQQGFILDCISSLISATAITVMAVFFLLYVCVKYDLGGSHALEYLMSKGPQPIRRMLTMRCNCPCYRTRPKLRFFVRVIILVLCMIFRMVAAILYSQANFPLLSILCGACEIFLIIPLAFDIYHYRVWWHYRPENDRLRKSYSPKHRRYLPHHLLGQHRDNMTLGNKPCEHVKCDNRALEHILIYHHSEHQPQDRWPDIKDKTDIYVGFHRTKAEFAVNIAHSDMRPSTTPPQMLGFGIYFARSIKHTGGKARHGKAGGGIICAKIRMGRVLEVDLSQIPDVRDTDRWHANYDTVYYTQNDERRDEFCIKSADQILEWVMVIEEECDHKVQNYGMDKEFNDTFCGCI